MSFRRFLLPSPVDLVFILLLVAVPILRGHHLLNTDGDLGRHLRVGETILAERALFYTDRFSHTMDGRPFVPYEWLSELLFAVMHRLSGLAGVVIFTALLLALSYGLVALFLQRSGIDPLTGTGTALGAAVVGAVHWIARPHLFTLLGAVLVLWLLERGGRRAPLLSLALFAVWANLHGGFLYGLVLIVVYLAGDLGEARWGDGRALWLGRARSHLLLLAGAVGGSLLNPVGPALLAHVVGYLGESYLVDSTAEYQSPDFHSLYGRLFLAALLAVIAILATSGRRPTLPRLLTILVSLAFALLSIRNIPLFALIALPLAVLHLARALPERAGALSGRLGAGFAEVGATLTPGAWSAAAAAALLLLPATPAAAVIPRQFDPRVFPVAAVELARSAGVSGRLFNEFTWGGYLLYAWPERRVFIDGQTDFYGEDLTREYADLRAARGAWQSQLDRREIGIVVLPPHAPLSERLAQSPRWRVWYADDTATILVRARGGDSP